MTIVLSNKIEFFSEMPIEFLRGAHVDAIANPCVGQRVVKDFICEKDFELGMTKPNRMRHLKPIAVLRKVRWRRMEMKLNSIAIRDGERAGRKLRGRLERDSLFRAVVRAGRL